MKQTFFIMVIAAFVFAGGDVHADERAVPNVIAYQSSLYDDGGNPIADGSVNALFRISDAGGRILYEENQVLDVVRGQVSALVGNGLTQNGAPTGGIPPSVFDPADAKYLEIQVGDFPPTPAMEIASVPYSNYAGVALGAADGVIDSLAIADASIAYDDLSADLVTRLSSELTGGRGADQIIYREDLDNLYRAPTAAATIGIRPGLVYSGANDMQGAIQDIDRAVKRRDERIDTEAESRQDADTAEVTARNAAISSAVTTHAAATGGVHGITGAIVGTNTVQTLSNKTLESPTINGGNVTSNVTVNAGVTIDGVDISATAATLQTNIDNEASTRATADLLLQANIDGKVSKSGDTMTGNLVIDAGSNISLGGVSRSNWPGFQSITHRSNSLSFGDATEWVGCVLIDDIYFCQTSAPCLVGEVLLGCSGYSNRVCAEGGGDADMCDFMGAWPSGNSCYAKAAQHGVGDLTTLQAHAICGRLYN